MRFSFVIFFCILSVSLSAQTKIDMDFPSCQYLQYHFMLKLGNKLDTIGKGRFDEQGKASFTLPDKYKYHRGVGNLSVPFGNKKINLILNGEEKISLKEIDADAEDVIISESKENKYLKEQIARLGKILNEYTALMNGEESQMSVLVLPQLRMIALEKEYQDCWNNLKNKELYASAMLEMLNYLSGYSPVLGAPQETVRQEMQDYVVNKLDLKDLYTSGFWNIVLTDWFSVSMVDDSLLLKQSRIMLERTTDIPTRRELTNTIIQLYSKYSKDELLMQLGSEYLTIPINGKPAPDLVTDGAPLKLGKTLIFFYDSDCGYCRNELNELKKVYDLLTNDHNAVRIISVSGDTDKDMYEELANTLPWKDKICDYKGFAGENFANYGIVGSPTIIIVDDEGIIRGRYARMKDFLK